MRNASWRRRVERALHASGTLLDREIVERQMETLLAVGADVWFRSDSDFPPRLEEIPEAPPFLFTRGSKRHAEGPAVAIVGTRAASVGGREIAFALAADLARFGVTIVSGLARGIDAAAHRGALEAGGSTIAVLGTGVEQCFPPEERELYDRIAAEGLLLTEFPPHASALKFHFPRRNRIVSGLACVTVVIEAGVKSGALLTAGWSLAQGRDVFAVPGDIREPRSKGTNRLLKEGALVLTEAADVLDLLFGPGMIGLGGPERRAARAEEVVAAQVAPEPVRIVPLLTEPLDRRIAAVLSPAPLLPEQIALETNAPLAEVQAALLRLELSGLASHLPGGLFRRSP